MTRWCQLVRVLATVTALGAGADVAVAASAEPPEIFAVVIGWNGGNRELPPLRFADDDAARFAAFFRGLATPQRPGRVWLYTELDAQTQGTLARAGLAARPDGAPTRAAVLAGLRAAALELAHTTSARRRALYVVYAGHGLRGRVLLKPTSSDEAALTGAELRAALADAALGDNPPEVFVFLDACRSESLFSDRGGSNGAADFGAAISDLEHRAKTLPIGVLTAARNGRPAGEVARLEAGFFSHVLGSGLAGAADANGDDVVSFGELAAFVSFHTQKLTGQIPWFEPPGGDLDAGAMDHRGRRARLLLPRDSGGRFLVAAGDGRPVFAEAYQRRGRGLRLTLPPGTYRVSREVEDQAGEVASVKLGSEGMVDLADASWLQQDAARGSGGDDEPETLRFSADFGSDVVSTLAAGYLAGRDHPADSRTLSLAVDLGFAPAPLALRGTESQLTVRLGRAFSTSVLALVAGVARSWQEANGEAFTFDRLALGLGWQRPFALTRRLLLAPVVSGGWSMVLRRATTGTAGNLRSPWLEAGLRADLATGGPYFLSLSAAYTARLIEIDGSGHWTSNPSGALGVGVVF